MKKLLWSIIVIVIGLLLLASSKNSLTSHSKLYSEGVVSRGKVINVSRMVMVKKSDLYFLDVEYFVNNKPYLLESKVAYKWPFIPEKGDEVEIIHSISQPEFSEIFSIRKLFILPSIHFIFGLCLIVWGIALLRSKK